MLSFKTFGGCLPARQGIRFRAIADFCRQEHQSPVTVAESQVMPKAHLIADVFMYETADGGRKSPALVGWRCPIIVSKEKPLVGFDALPLIDRPLAPGERRRIGFVLLHPDRALASLRAADRFYLWEGRFVGEAKVIS